MVNFNQMNRKLLAILILLASLVVLNAQRINDANVPEKVKKAFKNYYPEVQNLTWQKTKQGFAAVFVLENISAKLILDTDGKLLETTTTVSQSDLPQSIQEYVNSNYKEYKFGSLEKVVNNEGAVEYNISIIKKRVKKMLIFTNDGHLLNKEK